MQMCRVYSKKSNDKLLSNALLIIKLKMYVITVFIIIISLSINNDNMLFENNKNLFSKMCILLLSFIMLSGLFVTQNIMSSGCVWKSIKTLCLLADSVC